LELVEMREKREEGADSVDVGDCVVPHDAQAAAALGAVPRHRQLHRKEVPQLRIEHGLSRIREG
jgi:hypothetical protein